MRRAGVNPRGGLNSNYDLSRRTLKGSGHQHLGWLCGISDLMFFAVAEGVFSTESLTAKVFRSLADLYVSFEEVDVVMKRVLGLGGEADDSGSR